MAKVTVDLVADLVAAVEMVAVEMAAAEMVAVEMAVVEQLVVDSVADSAGLEDSAVVAVDTC